MSEILPTIGASGVWSLRDPFDTIYKEDVNYTCKAVRKISEIVAAGEDVKEEYYDRYQLPESVYKEHFEKDYSIITLISDNGSIIYVPSKYIVSWPDGDSVRYVVMGMLLTLGALPESLDPSFLSEKVKNLVKANLGHTPNVNFIALSEVQNKSISDHEALENIRKSQLEDQRTDYTHRVVADQALQRAKDQIEALQNLIISKGWTAP